MVWHGQETSDSKNERLYHRAVTNAAKTPNSGPNQMMTDRITFNPTKVATPQQLASRTT